MYKIAYFIGAYSYSIFILGILGFLNKTAVIYDSIIFLFISFYLLQGFNFGLSAEKVFKWVKKRSVIESFFLAIILLQVLINLLGVLGPELSFDALWYHLTLPKIFISEQQIFHIPGNLLYYSDMPKLVEMLYIPALMFVNEIFAKLIHFVFGIGCLIVIYKLARKFVSEKLSLLAVIIFYSNLVIGWLSITAFNDLARAFFEILTLYYLIYFLENQKMNNLIISAVMLGLAMSTKLISGLDILIFVPLILYFNKSIKNAVFFVLVAILIPVPWIIFSYANTGDPFFPFLSEVVRVPFKLSMSGLINFIHSPDPISPIYLISLPLLIYAYKKFKPGESAIALFVLLSFMLWLVIPQIGGGRFMAAYLPAYSVLIVCSIKYLKHAAIRNYVIFLIIFVGIISIIYRGIANSKYVPVVFGLESIDLFLSKNLNFSFGDFYDVDGYFRKNIKPGDRVLIYGIHNLYYVNFPFVHESYLEPNDKFNYILLKDSGLSDRYSNWRLVYANKKTDVKLYFRNN